jgi:hypothetical protein
MSERDKIIRDDYPVDRLPEDLREGLGGVSRVRVTVEADRTKRLNSWAEIKAEIEALHASPTFKPVSTEEAVARVRALRDEWDD